mgnify:CR=1 FL=1
MSCQIWHSLLELLNLQAKAKPIFERDKNNLYRDQKRKQDRHTYRPTGKNRRGYSRTDKCNRYDPDRRVYRKNAGNTCYLHQSAAPLHPAHVPGCRESELQRPSFALQGRLGR